MIGFKKMKAGQGCSYTERAYRSENNEKERI